MQAFKIFAVYVVISGIVGALAFALVSGIPHFQIGRVLLVGGIYGLLSAFTLGPLMFATRRRGVWPSVTAFTLVAVAVSAAMFLPSDIPIVYRLTAMVTISAPAFIASYVANLAIAQLGLQYPKLLD